jgi:hypothetical protein
LSDPSDTDHLSISNDSTFVTSSLSSVSGHLNPFKSRQREDVNQTKILSC